MAETAHRSGAGHAHGGHDNRLRDLTDFSNSSDLVGQSQKALGFDPFRAMGLERLSHIASHRPLFAGHIVYSLPYQNWYRVQLDGTGGTIGCTMGTDSNCCPMGPRTNGTVGADNGVIVWIPPGRLYGIILATYPVPQHDSRLPVSDCTQQGSMAGMKREDAYDSPHKLLYRQGGLHDFSADRTVDSTTNEWGKVSELGMGLGIDPFMTWMKASEFCGVWFHYWDNYTRLAGQNMDIVSYPMEIILRDDEGENRHIEYGNTYPWESVGLYTHGEPMHNEFDDHDVQWKLPKGKYDLADGEEDLQSINRYQEHGGYLGQGRHRWVMIPAKDDGKRFYKDDPKGQPDMGVFEEMIALDGTWSVRSAKQVFIGKQCLIPVAKEMRLPEDQKTGDDARQDNYKFSGEFGGGDEHKVKDIEVSGDQQHLRQAAGILDTLAYNYNWKPLHPFHYHKQDYKVPEESDIQGKSGAPERAQDHLDFDELASKAFMEYPTARQVKVDSRYGQVDYFQRQAGIALLPDGGICLFDGYGARITLSAGHIRFDCPGDIQLFAGRTLAALGGDDIDIRARNSLDLTAGKKDVTIKAEHNLRMLGGNEEQGGVLIESKKPFQADYDNKTGEDIVSGGIVLKAGQGSIVHWAQEIYLRTGGAGSGMGNGRIVLDASRGQDEILIQGNNVDVYSQQATNIWVGPYDTTDEVKATYNFTLTGAVLDKDLIVHGQTFLLSDAWQNGTMTSKNAYVTIRGTKEVIPSPLTAGNFGALMSAKEHVVENEQTLGQTEHKKQFPDGYYKDKQPGDDKTILQAEFSLRDDDGKQYGTDGDFKLLESRWQQMVRLGLGSGGRDWSDELTVHYQDREQLPWPSKKQWVDQPTLLQYQHHNMFDDDNGYDRDRPGPYEDPKLAEWNPATPASGFKVIEK